MITTNSRKYAQRFSENEKIFDCISEVESKPGYRADKSADLLRRLDILMKDKDYRNSFFKIIKSEDLGVLLQNPPNNLNDIVQMELPPTPNLIQEVYLANGDLATRLRKIVDFIENGNFDPDNYLHREIEFWKQGETDSNWMDKKFYNKGELIITREDHDKCLRTAVEAIDVFKAIVKLKDDNPTLVIGNSRYGANYVVFPIAGLLQAENVEVRTVRISSFDFTDKKIGRYYVDRSITDLINSKKPSVFVVDGTNVPYDNSLTRFPRAMWGYMDYFMNEVEGQYDIKFWAPDITSKFIVGDYRYNDEGKNSDADRNVYLMSSVKKFFLGSNAFFDDIDQRFNRGIECFSNNGYCIRKCANTEEEYVKAIQNLIKEKVESLL